MGHPLSGTRETWLALFDFASPHAPTLHASERLHYFSMTQNLAIRAD